MPMVGAAADLIALGTVRCRNNLSIPASSACIDSLGPGGADGIFGSPSSNSGRSRPQGRA